jgi:predicted small metal-binding protein
MDKISIEKPDIIKTVSEDVIKEIVKLPVEQLNLALINEFVEGKVGPGDLAKAITLEIQKKLIPMGLTIKTWYKHTFKHGDKSMRWFKIRAALQYEVTRNIPEIITKLTTEHQLQEIDDNLINELIKNYGWDSQISKEVFDNIKSRIDEIKGQTVVPIKTPIEAPRESPSEVTLEQ